MDQRIVIVGFMGSGKTTVAKALATRLGCGLADLDAIVSAQQNMSVPELINEQGEVSFRDAETAALQVVLDRQAPRIIALGGGAWTLERNRELIGQHGCLTVWLDARMISAGKGSRITPRRALWPSTKKRRASFIARGTTIRAR